MLIISPRTRTELHQLTIAFSLSSTHDLRRHWADVGDPLTPVSDRLTTDHKYNESRCKIAEHDPQNILRKLLLYLELKRSKETQMKDKKWINGTESRYPGTKPVC
jgi:hypothetical protein